MSTTIVVMLGLGVLTFGLFALLLVSLGWRIGRLSERIRQLRRGHRCDCDNRKHGK